MAQKEFAGTWRRILEDILGELTEARGYVTNTMKAAEEDATKIIKRFVEEIESTRKDSQEAITDLNQVMTYDLSLKLD